MRLLSVSFEDITFNVDPPTYNKEERDKYYAIRHALEDSVEGPFFLLSRGLGWFGPREVFIEHGELHKRISKMRPEHQKWLLNSLCDLANHEVPDRFEFKVPWGANARRTILVNYEKRKLQLKLEAPKTT